MCTISYRETDGIYMTCGCRSHRSSNLHELSIYVVFVGQISNSKTTVFMGWREYVTTDWWLKSVMHHDGNITTGWWVNLVMIHLQT